MKKLFLIMFAVMLFGLSSKATKNAVLIYNTDLVAANSFKALLDSNNFAVTLVSIGVTTTTDYTGYDVIITSPASQLTKTQMDTIDAKNKPIVCLGAGGYRSLGTLSLAIGSPNGLSGTENTMFVENASLTVYNSPININVNTGDSLRLFTVAASASSARMIYVPTPSASLEGLLRYKPLYYSVIRQNGKYTFWGFTLSPTSMTREGKDLFVNVVGDAITAYGLASGISSTTKTDEPSLSVNNQTGILSVGGVSGDAAISVYDLSGKSVVRSQKQPQINLSGLKKGVYLVKIASPKGVVAKKFIY